MHFRSVAIRTLTGAVVLLTSNGAVFALEVPKGEKEALKKCEKSLCDLVVKKAPATGDFTCGISKTWAKSDLKEGSAAGRLSWGYGDARCTINLKLARAVIVAAVKDAKTTVQFPDHTVTCLIEGDKEPSNVTAILAPKAVFEGGRVKKIWVNLKKVEGPSMIKGLALTAAKLEDKLGIFHKPLVKAVNKLLGERCPRVVAEN